MSRKNRQRRERNKTARDIRTANESPPVMTHAYELHTTDDHGRKLVIGADDLGDYCVAVVRFLMGREGIRGLVTVAERALGRVVVRVDYDPEDPDHGGLADWLMYGPEKEIGLTTGCDCESEVRDDDASYFVLTDRGHDE